MMAGERRLGVADIPKQGPLHLAWRYFVHHRLKADRRLEPVFEAACKRSAKFYINTFVWINEPRAFQSTLPMATWDFQDELIDTIVSNIRESAHAPVPGKVYDVLVEKSRGMGITWTVLVVFDWFWRFWPRSSFLCISKGEIEVDRTGDPKSLFYKLDFIEERLPRFLQVRGHRHDQYHGRTHLVVHNPFNGSAITGESANENAGRSGRYLAALRDEEAACQWGSRITDSLNSTTNVSVRVSTPNGATGSFYEARKGGGKKDGINIVSLHWSKHPQFAAGLYEWNGQELRVLDSRWHGQYARKYNRKYPFRREPSYSDPGSPWEFLRSPWFDAQVARSETVTGIAKELQISYQGSGNPFFNANRLAQTRRKTAREPLRQCRIEDLLGRDFLDADTRSERALCWFQVVGKLPPQKTTYTIACDISTGTGVSDSTISVGDDRLKCKVFEFKTNGMLPEEFAACVHAVADWFTTPEGKPFVAWDGGGPGQPFGVRLLQLGGVHAYYHREAESGKRSRLPGVPFSGHAGRNKLNLFTAYRTALFGGWYSTPSAEAFDQMGEYVIDGTKGTPEHVASKGDKVEKAADLGEQHGDMVASEVVLHLAMEHRPMPEPIKPTVPQYSMAWRQQQLATAAAAGDTAWCSWG